MDTPVYSDYVKSCLVFSRGKSYIAYKEGNGELIAQISCNGHMHNQHQHSYSYT
jgi:hypothetical protein